VEHAAVDPMSMCAIQAEKIVTEIVTATTDQTRDVVRDREIGIVREIVSVAEVVPRKGRNELDDRNPEIETVKENALGLGTVNVAVAGPHVPKDDAIAVTVAIGETGILMVGTWMLRRNRRKR
jgi:hypothetical protein